MSVPRAPDQIREDAVKMAIRKAQEGCEPCSRSYFELAKSQGATPDELSRAIKVAAKGIPSGVSRRDFIRIAMTTALGLSVAGLGSQAQPSEAASNYYGTDTYTQSLSKFPQNLYIGKLGSGTSNSTAAFNTAAAQLAGFYGTYEYWGLYGSGQAAIHGYTPYNWGVAQANSAIYYWHNSQYAYLVGGRTIFGDVEAANAGWSGYSQSDNRNTLNGYLDTIAANGFTPGVYVAPDEWVSFFGQTYRPTRGFVFWITKCQRCLVCAPCGSCNTTIANVDSRIGSVTGNIVGGTLPVVWQYWISACNPSCGDYDASIQSPSNGFSPRTSGTTWSCSGCGVAPCS